MTFSGFKVIASVGLDANGRFRISFVVHSASHGPSVITEPQCNMSAHQEVLFSYVIVVYIMLSVTWPAVPVIGNCGDW